MRDTIDMAREAGMESNEYMLYEALAHTAWVCDSGDLERFAALVAAAEREACARIAEEPSTTTYECTVACGGPAQTFQQRFPKHSHDIAKEIRARGNK
jgi:hypothetical protein